MDTLSRLRSMGNCCPGITIIYFCLKVLCGFRLYQALKREYGIDVQIYLLPWDGTGDAYYFACYFQEKAENSVVLCASDAGAQILNLCGVKNIKKVSSYQKAAMLLYRSLMDGTIQDIILAHYSTELHSDILSPMEGLHGLNYRDFYEIIPFQFDGVKRMGEAGRKNFQADSSAFEIVKGKTVVVAPTARSCESPSVQEWADLIAVLNKFGFKVIVNGDADAFGQELAATLIPYSDLLPVLDFAGYFIGIRCGLCDVIAGSSCKKIVLYPKARHRQGTYYDFYNLLTFPQVNGTVTQIELGDDGLTQNVIQDVLRVCLS